MGLIPIFVGFSSTDIGHFNLMQAWKAHDKIEFNFRDCQLEQAIRSEDEYYIKQLCRARINMASTYVLLIGKDTKYKRKYVLWETQVALEKRCKMIGVNLDNDRFMNPDTCPRVMQDVGAIFVPFSSRIVSEALKLDRQVKDNWHFVDSVYERLGYQIEGRKAKLIPTPAPWEGLADILFPKSPPPPASTPYTPFDPLRAGWPTNPPDYNPFQQPKKPWWET